MLSLGFVFFLPGKAIGGDVTDIFDVLLFPPGVAAVYPGELAPGWPENVPLPSGAQLAGSLKLKDESLVAAFTVASTIGDVASPYLSALQTESWILIGEDVGEDEEYHSYTLQREDVDLLALVLYDNEGTTYGTIYYGERDLADLRAVIELIADMFSSLADVRVLPEFSFVDAEVVDEAISPMSLFMDEETYQAKVKAEIEAVELKATLETQLTDAGWRAVDSGISGPTVWGRYELESNDGTWRAVLLVFTGEPMGTFFVSVHAYKIQ